MAVKTIQELNDLYADFLTVQSNLAKEISDTVFYILTKQPNNKHIFKQKPSFYYDGNPIEVFDMYLNEEGINITYNSGFDENDVTNFGYLSPQHMVILAQMLDCDLRREAKIY